MRLATTWKNLLLPPWKKKLSYAHAPFRVD